MWTISNFPVNYRLRTVLFAGLLFWGVLLGSCTVQRGMLVVPQAPSVAQDAPKAAVVPATPEKAPPVIDNTALREPVELRSVTIGKLDSTYIKYAPAQFLKTASAPLTLVVQTQKPMDTEPRTSWPVIELNGAVVKNTRMVDAQSVNTLVCFLPDRGLIKSRNTVTVVWVGNETLTRTRNPLVFSANEIRE